MEYPIKKYDQPVSSHPEGDKRMAKECSSYSKKPLSFEETFTIEENGKCYEFNDDGKQHPKKSKCICDPNYLVATTLVLTVFGMIFITFSVCLLTDMQLIKLRNVNAILLFLMTEMSTEIMIKHILKGLYNSSRGRSRDKTNLKQMRSTLKWTYTIPDYPADARVSFKNVISMAAKQFTLCFWAKPTGTSLRADCIVSFVKGETFSSLKQISVCLRMNENGGVCLISDRPGARNQRYCASLPMVLDRWLHLCICWNIGNGLHKVFLNGNYTFTKRMKRMVGLEGGETVILGQRIVPPYKFERDDRFIGELGELNVWSAFLSEEQIELLSTCNPSKPGDLFNFQNALPLETVIAAVKEEIDDEEFCVEEI